MMECNLNILAIIIIAFVKNLNIQKSTYDIQKRIKYIKYNMNYIIVKILFCINIIAQSNYCYHLTIVIIIICNTYEYVLHIYFKTLQV